MFKKKNVNNKIDITTANVVSIEGYVPDPENGRPYIVTAGGKLNVFSVTGYEKKPIRALIALAALNYDAPPELLKLVGEVVIVIDKKLEKMAKHPWSRKQVLAAIEYQCQMLIGVEDGDPDPRLINNLTNINGITESLAINAQILAGEKYGAKAITKITKKHNATLLKSEQYAMKHLHKAYKKASKAGSAAKAVVDDVTNAVEDLTEAVVETVSDTATKADTKKKARSGEVSDPTPVGANA